VFSLDEATKRDCLKLIELALIEDTGSSKLDAGVDCTTDSIIPETATASAALVSRQTGVVCGVEIARLVAGHFASTVTVEEKIADGQRVEPKQTIAILSGPAHDILTIERTCLNFMCRLSGISSLTHSFVEKVSGTKAKVLDTRKTTPGWRRIEKYAVACGGGSNHRMGLYDAIMIKDNHLAFYRSLVSDSADTIPEALGLARKWINDHASELPNGESTILQLEVDTLEQFELALATEESSRPDIVLLDNMSTDQLAEAVAKRDASSPATLLEASGGVNIDTIGGIAATGVDRISVGALTHSALNFDIGLDWLSRGS
jgi:nicotinate-nucleotide pyrophosphorylase (carboxylating)